MPDITKIVVTGGVCGGKTTALASIRSAFSRLGYRVITVPEPATEFKSNGILPWECMTSEEYQWCQMKVQITRERAFERAARGMDVDKVLIVCDRGMLDNKYYMTPEEFDRVIADLDYTEIELRDSYDAVFHLVTAAKGAEEFYTRSNNVARHETLEEAAAMDDGFIEAWAGHPHLRVIDNSTDFEGKMARLIDEISSFLGESAPYQIERKYLIEYPDLSWLEAEPACQKASIVQHYLRAEKGHVVRIRRSGLKGHHSYTLTEKAVDGTKKHLVRRQHLTKREYMTLLGQADPNCQPLEKTRWSLMYNGQYFDIDIYPRWDDQAVARIVLSSEDEQVNFPPQLHVIRDITDDLNYRNVALAACPAEAAHEGPSPD